MQDEQVTKSLLHYNMQLLNTFVIITFWVISKLSESYVLCIKSFPTPILLQDLPPLEELTITVDENVEMMCVGKIASIVGELGKLDQKKEMTVFW